MGESGDWLASYMQITLCGESKDHVRAMMGCFVEVCRIGGLKVNAGKSFM